jgi:hypothetical protein
MYRKVTIMPSRKDTATMTFVFDIHQACSFQHQQQLEHVNL